MYNILKCIIVSVTYVPNAKGKYIAILGKYTYYRDNRYKHIISWRCTRGRDCKACFRVSSEFSTIVDKGYFMHNHYPPNFILRNGIYYRI